MKIKFDDLTVNLYQLLEVESDASLDQIKDSYKQLILKYHPDKNPSVDPEFFSMISIAYKILKKPDTRQKYNNFLLSKLTKEQDHNSMRSSYKSYMNQKPHNQPNSGGSNKKNFYQKMEELNRKHNYNEAMDSGNINNRLSELEVQRSNMNVNYANIFNNSKSFNTQTFNNAFQHFKNGDNSLNPNNQSIIKADSSLVPSAFNGLNDTQCNYSSITEIDKLYAEDDDFFSENYTSLENAFSIKQTNNYTDTRSIEQKLAERERQTDNLSSLSVNDFHYEKDFSILDRINNN